MTARHSALLCLLCFAIGVPETRAGTELNFWHAYVHAKTGVTHYGFNLVSFKRGLFFGSCGPSTRSQLWSFTFDLAGDGPAYAAGQVTLASDAPRSVKVTGGTVTIDSRRKQAVIALQVEEAGRPADFVGNGTYRIHAPK